ncbi:hypothetical protein JIQ42_01548 [Leishmania sp. Namibia]|uniref:hypothetical protein n=1 Tax=Leishmania sp. Namibia TaxID=2802991 RepID=UPI001B5FE97B|nr:hypothetical protein JIQ42_01548 [Leishmania sp. Namibia]
MQPPSERRVLVYHCGSRSVVNVSRARTSSCLSPSRLTPSKLSAPLQGSGPHEAADIVGNTATTADGWSAPDSPCRLLAVDTVAEQEDACCRGGVLFHTTLSPAPSLPPPPSPARCANKDAGDASDSPKTVGIQAMSKGSAQHSLQGVSPSPFADDAQRRGDSAALPGSDYHISSFAEWPHAAVAASSPVLLSCDQGGAKTSARCDASEGVPATWLSDTETDDHETMLLRAPPPLVLASAFPTRREESVRYSDPCHETCGEHRSAVAALREKSNARPLSPLPASSNDSEIAPIPTTGAERVLFGDGDDLMDMSTTSRYRRTPRPELQKTAAMPCAADDAVAHTPPRPRDARPRAPPFPNRSDTGRGKSGDCNSHEHFAVNYTATFVSSSPTPATPVLSTVDGVGAADELLDAKEPSRCGSVKECPVSKNSNGDAEKLSPAAKNDQVECTPCASTTTRRASGSLPTLETPIASPLRQELFLRLLTAHGASGTHTPTARTCSSVSSLPNGGVLATPTPLRASHRWRGASATPGWESLAQITGFPTPVKLSPIPTKGYSAYPALINAAAAAAAAPTVTSTPHASASSSPAVSAIEDEYDERIGDRRDAATLSAVAAKRKETEQPRSVKGQRTAISAFEERGVPPPPDSDIADYLSSGHSISTISSQGSMSPICVRAGQTTRVWTPQPSEVSQQQQQHLTQLPASPVESHSSRLLSDFPSSTAVPPPPLPQQQTKFLRNAATCGTANVHLCDHAFSAPSDLSRTALRSNRVADEASEDSTAISSMLTEAQAQPLSWQPQPPHCPTPPTVDLALMHRCSDPSTGERATPCYAADTLNLGTPTVSMIRSPVQALGESCCSLFMLPTTQYIQALPIPGLGRRIPSASHAAQRAGIAVEGVGGESGSMTLNHEANRNRRRETQRPALMSPTLRDNGEGGKAVCSAAARTRAELALPRFPAPPPGSPNASEALNVPHHWLAKSEEVRGDANHRTGTSASVCPRKTAGHQDPGQLDCSVMRAPPLASSFASQLQHLSTSKVSATPLQASRLPHLARPSARDASQSADASYVRYRPTLETTSQSSTYFIDSWL